MIDGIIFDVDGTLWDTTPIVERAWNAAIKDSGVEGISVTADRLKGLFGLPMMKIIDNIMPDEELSVKENFLAKCSEYEFEYIEREGGGIQYPGMEDVFKYFRDSVKIPIFIVSNCQGGYIELYCELTGYGHYISAHLCPDDTGLVKAGNIQKIVEEYGLKSPVYVGDTQMDANACKEAGVPIVFAEYGFGSVKEPDYTISTPKDLIELF